MANSQCQDQHHLTALVVSGSGSDPDSNERLRPNSVQATDALFPSHPQECLGERSDARIA